MLLYPVFCSFVLNHVPLFAKGFEAFRLGIRPSGAIASDIGVLWVGSVQVISRDEIKKNMERICNENKKLGKTKYLGL